MVDTNGIITTVAGSGILGYSGDGNYAVNAQLARPSGVAIDESGNLHIADSGNNCIRKVDKEGIITTVAGLGGDTWGYSGDRGPAVNAQLAWPSSIAFDKSGNFYIADSGNHCIRTVDTSGNITTIAGNGTWGYSGKGGPAVKAQLFWPSGVTVDELGNLYISDYGNNCIRKVDTKGHIATIVGLGGDETWGYSGDGGVAVKAQLAFPSGLTVDESGNLYIADLGNDCIRKVDTEGIITTIAGNDNVLAGLSGADGSSVDSQLNWPSGVTVDGSGDLYIADSSNNRILKTEDQMVSSIANDAEQKQVVLLTKMEDQ
jgi:sugar lactone lactonase YvrE